MNLKFSKQIKNFSRSIKAERSKNAANALLLLNSNFGAHVFLQQSIIAVIFCFSYNATHTRIHVHKRCPCVSVLAAATSVYVKSTLLVG